MSSSTFNYIIAQDCQTLWNQCQRYNTIALDAYKKCNNKMEILAEKYEDVQIKYNNTKEELTNCQESGSKFTLLVVIPWILLGTNINSNNILFKFHPNFINGLSIYQV